MKLLFVLSVCAHLSLHLYAEKQDVVETTTENAVPNGIETTSSGGSSLTNVTDNIQEVSPLSNNLEGLTVTALENAISNGIENHTSIGNSLTNTTNNIKEIPPLNSNSGESTGTSLGNVIKTPSSSGGTLTNLSNNDKEVSPLNSNTGEATGTSLGNAVSNGIDAPSSGGSALTSVTSNVTDISLNSNTGEATETSLGNAESSGTDAPSSVVSSLTNLSNNVKEVAPLNSNTGEANGTSLGNAVSNGIDAPFSGGSALTSVPSNVKEVAPLNNTSEGPTKTSSENAIPQGNETTAVEIDQTSSMNKTQNDKDSSLVGRVTETSSENVTPQTVPSLDKTLAVETRQPLINRTPDVSLLDRSGAIETTSTNKISETPSSDKTNIEEVPMSSTGIIPNAKDESTTDKSASGRGVIERSSENITPQTKETSALDKRNSEEVQISQDNISTSIEKTRLDQTFIKSESSPANKQRRANKISSSDKTIPDSEILSFSDKLGETLLFNQSPSNLNTSRLVRQFPKTVMGCNRISYIINTNWRNTWKAIPYPQGTPYFNVGYGWLDGKGRNTDISYEEELECPPSMCRLPSSYDSRRAYPMCTSLQEPLDQGCYCRASWAVSAASALSDRFCISSGGAIDLQLSAQQVLSCCKYCGEGCQGGKALYAWLYFHDHGIVTGSQYGYNRGCQPYSIKPCMTDYKSWFPISTPECSNTCQPSFYYNYQNPFLYKAAKVYTLSNSSVDSIKKEIFFRGPVTADMKVYEDFQCYKSGIYGHVVGDYLGYKTIKLIGWGEERGIPYWIATNTWGLYWGENGFFRVRIDSDGYNIPNSISAGIPLLRESVSWK